MRYRILIILFAGVCFLMLSAHATPCRDHIRLAYLEAGASTRLVEYYEKMSDFRKSILGLAKSYSIYEGSIVTDAALTDMLQIVQHSADTGRQLRNLEEFITSNATTPNRATYLREYLLEMGLVPAEVGRPSGMRYTDYLDHVVRLLLILLERTENDAYLNMEVETIRDQFLATSVSPHEASFDSYARRRP